jgi:hypothetical protein
MTFICLNIELRTQPLIILVVIAGTDKERPGCSKIQIVNNNTVFIFMQLVPFCVFQMVSDEVSGIIVIYRR